MEIKTFKTSDDFEKWLEKNFTKEEGIWLRFYKKSSGIIALNYNEALDAALCYGWIDGQAKSLDEKSWIQKFTPRRKRSLWSVRNIGHTERLIKEGRMKEPGVLAIKSAKEDGRWEKAYDPQGDFKIPDDFLLELKKNPKAEEFFNKLNKTNKFAIYWKLNTVKRPETREKWRKKYLEMFSNGEKIH